MSYIQNKLDNSRNNNEIKSFLLIEGFKEEKQYSGREYMEFVTSDCYTVWFQVFDDLIYLNAEYECGGTIAERNLKFEKDNLESFMKQYEEAVEWTVNMVRH